MLVVMGLPIRMDGFGTSDPLLVLTSYIPSFIEFHSQNLSHDLAIWSHLVLQKEKNPFISNFFSNPFNFQKICFEIRLFQRMVDSFEYAIWTIFHL